MAATLYALLVGINRYRAPQIRPLRGCVADIGAIGELLDARARDGWRLEARTLRDEQASYEAVVAGFIEHLARAGPGDAALFYFCGHGSQQPSPPTFWPLEPDRLDETIVCHDSRTPGVYDLADKELAHLIAAVAAGGAHVAVVLDCCHSGSGTRDEAVLEGARHAPADRRPRPIDSYRAIPAAERARLAAGTGPAALPEGPHVLISACRDYEVARERPIGGVFHGLFSHYLLDTLRRGGRFPTYRDLFKRVELLVQNAAPAQSPQIAATAGLSLDQPFLGGAVAAADQLRVRHRAGQGWTLDAGLLQGIPAPAGDDAARLAVFPPEAGPAEMADLSRAVAEASVLRALPGESLLDLRPRGAGELDPQEVYRAALVSLPLPRLGVRLEGEPAGLAALREALGRSPYVVEGEAPGAGGLAVLAAGGRYSISRADDPRPIAGAVEGYGAAQAARVRRRLEHIARWQTIAELTNPGSRLAGAVRLELRRVSGPPALRSPGSEPSEEIAPEGGARLEYRQARGRWQPPAYKIRIVNSGAETVYCALAYLSEQFGVGVDYLPGDRVARLGPGEEAWAVEGRPIDCQLADIDWRRGATERRDRWKLIVSSEPFDATLLAQDELDRFFAPGGEVRAGMTSLERLLGRAQRRGADRGEARARHADWTTLEAALTIVRPREPVSIGPRGADLGLGVRLGPHPALAGRARLLSLPQASELSGGQPQPAALREGRPGLHLLQLSEPLGADPGLCAIELAELAGQGAVGAAAPLPVELDRPELSAALQGGAGLLAYAHDGERWRGLGEGEARAGGVRLALRELPAGGAVVIFIAYGAGAEQLRALGDSLGGGRATA